MVAALKQGRIAAAMLGEPLLTPAKDDIEVLGNAFAAVAPAWISSVFVISKAWATANPDATRRFVAAMRETARFANTHHAETAKIFGPVAGIDPALFATMTRATYGEQLTRALLQPGIDTAVKYGALKQPFDTAADRHANPPREVLALTPVVDRNGLAVLGAHDAPVAVGLAADHDDVDVLLFGRPGSARRRSALSIVASGSRPNVAHG